MKHRKRPHYQFDDRPFGRDERLFDDVKVQPDEPQPIVEPELPEPRPVPDSEPSVEQRRTCLAWACTRRMRQGCVLLMGGADETHGIIPGSGCSAFTRTKFPDEFEYVKRGS